MILSWANSEVWHTGNLTSVSAVNSTFTCTFSISIYGLTAFSFENSYYHKPNYENDAKIEQAPNKPRILQ